MSVMLDKDKPTKKITCRIYEEDYNTLIQFFRDNYNAGLRAMVQKGCRQLREAENKEKSHGQASSSVSAHSGS